MTEASEHDALGHWLRRRLRGEAASNPVPDLTRLEVPTGAPVYLGARVEGRLSLALSDHVRTGETAFDALARIVEEAAAIELDPRRRYFEICIGHEPIDMALIDRESARGLLAFEVGRGHITPFDLVAWEGSLRDFWHGYEAERGANLEEVRAWTTRQWVVDLGPDGTSHALFRSAPLVSFEHTTRNALEQFVENAAAYLERHVDDRGALTYELYPTTGPGPRGRENLVRRWMTAMAMNRAAARDLLSHDTVERNIAFNLERYYEPGPPMNQVRGAMNLGSLAGAALTILEHPSRERFARAEAGLFALIDGAWRPDGSFQTVLRPESTSIGLNFYPGEALYALARREQLSGGSPARRKRIAGSLAHHREWHLEPSNRNPAFVPWHAAASRTLWEVTGEDWLAAWVLEMCDWLMAGVRRTTAFPDLVGQWKWPGEPSFGQPHSSSTGVYAEAMLHGFAIARALGDDQRCADYRSCIALSLRQLLQQTFKAPWEAFYTRDPERYVGGVRCGVFSSMVRCDNVQHALLASMMALDAFDEEDWSAVASAHEG